MDALDDIDAKAATAASVDCGQVSSDEVRIMRKVLGGNSPGGEEAVDADICLRALNVTDWHVHRAIKVARLRASVERDAPSASFSDADVLGALKTRDWDVSKAANVLLRQVTE